MNGNHANMHIIDGKGHRLKWIPAHLISTAIIWTLLRFTLFNVPDIDKNLVQYLVVSIFFAFCMNMAMFGKVFQQLAEVGQMIEILKKFSTDEELELTKDELYAKINELQVKRKVLIRGKKGLSYVSLKQESPRGDLVLDIR